MALAKGGLTDQHCLIIPVQCVSNLHQASSEAMKEVIQYVSKSTEKFKYFN